VNRAKKRNGKWLYKNLRLTVDTHKRLMMFKLEHELRSGDEAVAKLLDLVEKVEVAKRGGDFGP